MSTFNKVTDELVQELKSVLGEKGVTVDPEKIRRLQNGRRR